MWTQVTADDAAGLDRQIAIMQQMDGSYLSLRPSDLRAELLGYQGELWHYQGQGFEIGMLFRYSPERIQWQLAQVGFVGSIQPAQALDINVLRGRDFMRSHDTTLFAARPKRMDFPPILVYYDLCLTHPNLRITVVADLPDKVIWEIAYVGP